MDVPFPFVFLQAGDVADLSGSTGAGAGAGDSLVVSSLQKALCALALLFRQVAHTHTIYCTFTQSRTHYILSLLLVRPTLPTNE